jgi:hypothetical protein
MAQCEGFNRNDQRCGNEALPGSRYCHITAHAQRRITPWYRLAELFRSHPAVVILSVIGLIGALVGATSFMIQLATNHESATSGTISPSGLAPAKYLLLAGVELEEKNREGIVLKDGDEPILTVNIRPFRSVRCLWMWRCQNQMLVSWKLRNTKGELVAEINNNEWSHQPRPAIFDRNYTNHILEIRDGTTGKVSLQLVDLGEMVYVAGTFLCSHSGWTFTVGPGNGVARIQPRPPCVESSIVIAPLCEYPSSQHLGQCSSKSVESLIKPEYRAYPIWNPIPVCTDLAAEELRKATPQP